MRLPKRTLRFRIKRGVYEIELEGDFEYVQQKFEEYMRQLSPGTPPKSLPVQKNGAVQTSGA
jgi:hypothetical protein